MNGTIKVNHLLLCLARLSDGNRHALIDMEKATREAGLRAEETAVAAQYLRRKGWARLELLTGKGYAQITAAGLDEADRLQAPVWRRWARDRVVAVAVVVSLLTNLLVLVLRELIPRLGN